MINKNIYILLLFATGLATTFWLVSEQSDRNSIAAHENQGKNPGYFEFYQKIKQNEFGEIPSGMAIIWHKADKRNRAFKKSLNNLENITELGPDNIGGRTRAVLIDSEDENIIFAGSVSGGIWKSTNGGSSWLANNDYAPTLAVTAITQSPFNPDMIYYTTGEVQGRSTGNINGLGIFRSDDKGDNFEHLEHTANDNFDQTWDIAHSLVYDSTIYVATHGAGIWKSSDAGDSFERVFFSASSIHEIEVFEDSTIQFSVDGYGIVQMHERTLTTTKLGNGFPTSGIGRISFDKCDAYPQVLYAHVLKSNQRELHGCYKSSNGGKSWYPSGNPGALVNYSQGWYDFKMAVSPTDSNFLISSAVNAGYTINGGSTWTRLANSHADYHEITFNKSGNTFIIGNDGGIYKYFKISMNQTYTNLNKGYNVTQYYAGGYAPEDSEVIVGAQDNGTHYNFNGNTSFSAIFGADGSYCAVHQQDPDIMYLSYQYMNIRRRENNQNINISSALYAELNNDQSNVFFIHPYEVNPLNGDQLFVPTKKELYVSSNKGTSWKAVTLDLPGETFAVGLSNEQNPTVYAAGSGSTLFRINDALNATAGNEKWLFTSSPPDFRSSFIGCVKVDPNDKGTVYCAMTNISTRGRIWRVRYADTDTPLFENLHSNLPEGLPVNWIEIDPDNSNFLLLGTEYGLYTSTNSGGWWEKETRFPNVCIDQMRLRYSDRKLFIFTHGRGAWTADLLTNPTSMINSADQTEIKVFPNPASTYVIVQGTDVVKLNLFNSSGQLIASAETDKMETGTFESGVYFLEIHTGKSRMVRKLILSKP